VDEKPAGTAPWDAFGTYLRNQRHLAQLSLRQLADLTKVSNPYLSQIERGLHRPSIAIIKSLAEALNLSTSDLLAYAADIASDDQATTTTEGAIRNDPLLNDVQKSALLAVYRSMVDVDVTSNGAPPAEYEDEDGGGDEPGGEHTTPAGSAPPRATGTAPKRAPGTGTRARSQSGPQPKTPSQPPVDPRKT
jgi:transcriptional regulator with XRE-family HTH domain